MTKISWIAVGTDGELQQFSVIPETYENRKVTQVFKKTDLQLGRLKI